MNINYDNDFIYTCSMNVYKYCIGLGYTHDEESNDPKENTSGKIAGVLVETFRSDNHVKELIDLDMDNVSIYDDQITKSYILIFYGEDEVNTPFCNDISIFHAKHPELNIASVYSFEMSERVLNKMKKNKK